MNFPVAKAEPESKRVTGRDFRDGTHLTKSQSPQLLHFGPSMRVCCEGKAHQNDSFFTMNPPCMISATEIELKTPCWMSPSGL